MWVSRKLSCTFCIEVGRVYPLPMIEALYMQCSCISVTYMYIYMYACIKCMKLSIVSQHSVCDNYT